MSGPATHPLAAIAKLLMITERRVQQLSLEGVIPRAERGRYELVPAVQGYIRYLRERTVGADAADAEGETHKSRLLRAQADKAEIETAALRGALVPGSEIARADERAMTALRDRLLAIPNACADRAVEAAGRGGAKSVAGVVRAEIVAAMADLSTAEAAGEA